MNRAYKKILSEPGYGPSAARANTAMAAAAAFTLQGTVTDKTSLPLPPLYLLSPLSNGWHTHHLSLLPIKELVMALQHFSSYFNLPQNLNLHSISVYVNILSNFCISNKLTLW